LRQGGGSGTAGVTVAQASRDLSVHGTVLRNT
jgi:hypothetical protein